MTTWLRQADPMTRARKILKPEDLPTGGHPRDEKKPSEKNETAKDIKKLGRSGDRNKLARLG